jgi:hypothetical protein
MGQVLMFAASYLPYYITEMEDGIRYVITAFSDKFTAICMRDILLSLKVEVMALNFAT